MGTLFAFAQVRAGGPDGLRASASDASVRGVVPGALGAVHATMTSASGVAPASRPSLRGRAPGAQARLRIRRRTALRRPGSAPWRAAWPTPPPDDELPTVAQQSVGGRAHFRVAYNESNVRKLLEDESCETVRRRSVLPNTRSGPGPDRHVRHTRSVAVPRQRAEIRQIRQPRPVPRRRFERVDRRSRRAARHTAQAR